MKESPIAVGRRIVVYGRTGSGKTTVSRRLGATLGLIVIEMDAVQHANGWNSVSFYDMRRKLEPALDGAIEGWVCDGNYSQIRDIVLSRADTIVWLHLPWRVSFWRLFKRTIVDIRTKRPIYEGSPARQTWRTTFLSRDSILLWSIRSHPGSGGRLQRAIAEYPSLPVFELRSPKQVDVFLRSVTSSPGVRP
ncbi:MAG TPA: adenylate kinase [Dehalococcoidia bacterium]|nr:adenylate kinase [Dehalococcoidia bacterium]